MNSADCGGKYFYYHHLEDTVIFSKFEARLVYKVSSKIVKAT